MRQDGSETAQPREGDDEALLARVIPSALTVPESGIVEVFNYGRNKQGLIPLLVGESDQATPSFISAAAIRSIEAGETFYTYQRGIPELRETIARYMTQLYGATQPVLPERFFVTVGGMHALQIAMRMIGGPGDEFLLPTPAWPNFAGGISALGGHVVESPMIFLDGLRRWTIDVDGLDRAVTSRTRAIIINSPSNPLGWMATREELQAVLALARKHGLWIIADEIYGRFVFDVDRAPSFHDIMDEKDLILFPQTLSKNWAMTGWRIGWLEAPPALGQIIENLVQYSTSGVAVPTQRAAAVAIASGDEFIVEQVTRARVNRDLLCGALAATGKVRFAVPEGAFYLFCAIDGHPDSRKLALRLIDEAGLGTAPGVAFGAGGEDSLRLCFARSPEQIREVARRLTAWIEQHA